MILSAGIFLIRKDNRLLIAHPTKKASNVWDIPKGRLNEGEHPIEAAVRETFEETNIDVSNWKLMHNLEPIKYEKSDKILYPYALFEYQNDFDFNEFELKCNSNLPEKLGGYPEMDDYKWVTIDEAKELLRSVQLKCIYVIEELMIKLENDRKKYKKS
jgi:8-oxo-dGTP pyrophosphatase MutT (NUDIX family)